MVKSKVRNGKKIEIMGLYKSFKGSLPMSKSNQEKCLKLGNYYEKQDHFYYAQVTDDVPSDLITNTSSQGYYTTEINGPALFAEYLDRALSGGRDVLLDNLVDYGKKFDIKNTCGTKRHEDATKAEISKKLTEHFGKAMEAGEYKRSARILETFNKNDLPIPETVNAAIAKCSNPKEKAKLENIISPQDAAQKQAQSMQDALLAPKSSKVKGSIPPQGMGTGPRKKLTQRRV